MRDEVVAHAGEELLLADPGDELLEDRRALGVGDAVEVHLDGLEVVVELPDAKCFVLGVQRADRAAGVHAVDDLAPRADAGRHAHGLGQRLDELARRQGCTVAAARSESGRASADVLVDVVGWVPVAADPAPALAPSTGRTHLLLPTLVYDDGRFTYLRFPGNREATLQPVFHGRCAGIPEVAFVRIERPSISTGEASVK